MGLFDHLKFWVNMQGENALNRAEDPSQVFDYSYQKQLEQLQQLRQGLVVVVQNEKHIEMLEAQVEVQMNRLQQQAVQAMQMNREDLARTALQRREALTAQVVAYKQQLEHLAAEHQKLEVLEQQVTQRIQTFHTQKEMVKAQYQAAQAQVHINEIATGLSKESTQMNLAMQARANAIDTLLESGSLGDQGLLGSGEPNDLDHQLAQISSQHNVDEQLAAMRQQLSGPHNS